MKSLLRRAAWLAAGTVWTSAVLAQPAPAGGDRGATNPLAAAVDAAWQRAVQTREVEALRRSAQAQQAIAASPWAAPPTLGVSYRDDPFGATYGGREAEVFVSWPLWLPGQRDARGASAGAERDFAEAAARAARLRLAGEVRELAWGLAAAQSELAFAEANRASLLTLADDVDRRVRAGDLAPADALAARAEATAATVLRSEAQQRLQALRTRWLVLTGLHSLPDPSEEHPSPSSLAVGEHPEWQQSRRAVELARKRLEQVRLTRRDAPDVIVRLISDVAGRGEHANTSIGAALRLPLATEDRNQPLLAAAAGELDVAQAREQRVTDRLRADVDAAGAAVSSVETQVAAERERATLLRERALHIEKSFRAGETPLPELLRALGAAAQADAALARRQATLGLARAQLLQALGHTP